MRANISALKVSINSATKLNDVGYCLKILSEMMQVMNESALATSYLQAAEKIYNRNNQHLKRFLVAESLFCITPDSLQSPGKVEAFVNDLKFILEA